MSGTSDASPTVKANQMFPQIWMPNAVDFPTWLNNKSWRLCSRRTRTKDATSPYDECHASVSTREAFHLKPATCVLEASADGWGKGKHQKLCCKLLSSNFHAACFICGAQTSTVLCPRLRAKWWRLTLALAENVLRQWRQFLTHM